MNAIKLNSSVNLVKEEKAVKPYAIYKKFMDFAESQTEKRAAWFAFSLLGLGVLFLPVPAALMYYYNASIWTLVITIGLFFASFIAGMGGSKVSALIALLGLNIIVNMSLILMYVL